MNIILLCGGSGKRLWPLSNDVRSKQFIEAFRTEEGQRESMLQRLVRQIRFYDPEAEVTFATSVTQVSAIKNQVGEDAVICEEPSRRDTLPAIALAASFLLDIRELSPEVPVLICPVDSFVDYTFFDSLGSIEKEIKKGTDGMVLLGVHPTYPSEQYGYIVPKTTEAVCSVAKFYEKPDQEKAKKLIASGALWNCGVYAMRLGYLLNQVHRNIQFDDYQDLLAIYDDINPISFEKAIVEKEQSLAVLHYEGEWKKLDTWESLIGSITEENIGNVHIDGKCSNIHIINELDLPILALGLNDTIISASPEGILVTDRKSSSNLKPMVDGLTKRGVMFADKSWGKFQVLDVESESLTVKATIRQGHRMSYHSHERRDEVWTIVSGKGRTIVDGMEQPIQAGDVITMQAGCRHTIIADTELKLIEVQLGKEISVHDKHEYELED